MASVPDHLRELVDGVRDAVDGDHSVAITGASSRTILDHERSFRLADRHVVAPSGVLDHQPDEMIVRVGAGTRLDDLRRILADRHQTVVLPGTGTVGGALARGWSNEHRLGHGALRDAALQILFVDHRGRLIRVGGPTVKNVTGFDLTRVLVGSLGTLGFIGDVILRTRPIPLDARWCVVDDVDRRRLSELQRRLYRPTSLIWNGNRLFVHLEGHPRDIDEAIAECGATECDAPRLAPYRWSMSPADALDVDLDSDDHVEVGVGIIHRTVAPPARTPLAPEIHRRIDEEFNPRRLLNPQILGFGERQGANALHSSDTV